MSSGGREIIPPAQDQYVRSGELGDVLSRHAYDRCLYFFRYLFGMKMLVALGVPLPSNGYAGAVSEKATHQADQGFRSDQDAHASYDKKDSSMLHETATGFDKMDAAHFCNLGISKTFHGSVVQSGTSSTQVESAMRFLVAMMSDTQRLPQDINIGSDRKIDAVHAQLAVQFLNKSGTVVSLDNIRIYIINARAAMVDYAEDHKRQGNDMRVAAAQVFIERYDGGGFEKEIFQALSNLWYECKAQGLDPSEFVEGA
ncbi:MAG: hypothetical protein ACI9G1_002045 [Pirellulaceae bacterium]|jgi:hypothetical protein